MSVVETHWQERQARSEDGIFFAADDFIELCGDPLEGYRADLRAPITTVLRSAPDGWTDLDELCSAEAGNYRLWAGSTSWEGAGFVAVEERIGGRLLWLLHLGNSEPFTEISSAGSVIHAISEEYAFRSKWQIPIQSPENFAVSQSRIV